MPVSPTTACDPIHGAGGDLDFGPATWPEQYRKAGFAVGIPVLSAEEAAHHRAELERAEARLGTSLHYVLFPNLIFAAAEALMRHPRVLDAVEEVLGPDILAYESSFIIKEPGQGKKVSWHQDLTYWGLDTDDLVTAWIALTPATPENGCMRMIPGSHADGMRRHQDLREADNILSRGQTIADADEAEAVSAALAAGEMSLHHGWTMHASAPNTTEDRRIGFSIVFLRPDVRTKSQARETAMLVRGEDRFGHYDPLPAFTTDFDPALMAAREDIDRRRNATWQAG